MNDAPLTSAVALSLRIAADHPALPGHFPGSPLVPGVLLLAETLARLGCDPGATRSCRRLLNAKFLQPVRAEQTVTVECRPAVAGEAEQTVQLTLRVAARSVAQFTLELGPGRPLPQAPAPTAHE